MGLLATSTANAQQPAPSSAPAAQALYEDGRAAMERGDYETACARFQASDQAEAGAGVRASLAACLEHRGLLATAWETFGRAAAMLPAGDERRARMEARRTALEARVPKLILSREPDAPPSMIVTDETGATVGSSSTWGIPLPFDPGPHRFTVTAPSHAAASFSVYLGEGQIVTLPVRPGRVVGSAAPAEDNRNPYSVPGAATPASAGPGPGPWVVGGVGVVGLVVGIATGAVVLTDRSAVNAECSSTTRTCTLAGHNAAVQGSTLGPVTTVGLVVGAAGLAAGGIWLGVAKAREKSAVGIAVGPMLAGGAVRLGGSW